MVHKVVDCTVSYMRVYDSHVLLPTCCTTFVQDTRSMPNRYDESTATCLSLRIVKDEEPFSALVYKLVRRREGRETEKTEKTKKTVLLFS